MPQSWDMGQILSLPLRREACRGFFKCPKNPTTSAGFEPTNSGTRGQNANHLPSKAVDSGLNIIFLCTSSLKASRWVRSDCVAREFGGVEEERRETKSCKYRRSAVLSMLRHTRRIFPHVLLLSAHRHFPFHKFFIHPYSHLQIHARKPQKVRRIIQSKLHS